MLTPLDPFSDLVAWLSYLTSRDYVSKLLVRERGLSTKGAERRAARVIHHMVAAISFIQQSMVGPPEMSFLPAYYALLNMAKVYIIFSPRHKDLVRHGRWHGATYDAGKKYSRSLLTECITLRQGGALALFYETLAGTSIGSDREIAMRDIYPFIAGISAEYTLATGEEAKLASIVFKQRSVQGGPPGAGVGFSA
ncbi:MAG: hypothetical protein ABIH46_12125 [Chloroflexota bacterium]